MTTTQPTRGRAGRLRARLSDRDLEVLQLLYRLRLMNSRQVQRACLTGGSPHTRTRRTRALLQRLSDQGLIVRLDRIIGGGRSGSTAYLVGLSGLGLAVLGVEGPYGRRRRRVWDTKPYFTGHVLAVAELYVNLSEQAHRGDVRLRTYDGEPAAWRRYPSPSGAAAVLKPDAFVQLDVGPYERSAFIEIDMGTESLPTVSRKCAAYASFFRTGIEQRAHGLFPLVLWLVPSEARLIKVQEVIDRLVADVRHLFAVALQTDGAALLSAPVEGRA